MGGAVILGIETSVEQVGVALVDHRGVLAHSSLASERRHAESLAPMISFVLDQAGAAMSDLSAVAVDVGPGLFTGMRVGIAAAQSLAWALEIPVAPVCSLDALAHDMSWSEDVVATALDARRGEVYWCLHRPRAIDPAGPGPMTRVGDPVVGSPEDLAIHLADRGETVWCAGTGFERHRASFEPLTLARFAGTANRYPTATAVALLGQSAVAAEATVDPDRVAPLYLRAPDAEIHWATRDGAR